MKNYLSLALTALLFASHVSAYENPGAGFTLKDGSPAFTVEGKHFYGYSALQSHKFSTLKDATASEFHLVNFYSSTDVQKLLKIKHPFTNKDFEDCYNNISLLKRAELDPELVQHPLLKLFFRNQEQMEGNLSLAPMIEKLGLNSLQQKKLLPTISVGEYNKQKYIRLSYLYQQGDDLYSLTCDMLANHDNLYVLSIMYISPDYFTVKKIATASPKQDQDLSLLLEKSIDIKSVKLKDVNREIVKQIDNSHSKLLKAFKTVPNARIRHEIGYYDTILGHEVIIPQNWLLVSLRGYSKDMAGQLYLTTSLDSLKESNNEDEYKKQRAILLTRIQRHSKNNKYNEPDSTLENDRKQLLQLNVDNILGNLDSLLIAGSLSFKKDSPFKAIKEQPEEAKAMVQTMLNMGVETLTGLVKKANIQEQADFNNLSYRVGSTPQGLLVKLNADLLLLNKYNYSCKADAICNTKDLNLQQLLLKQGSELDSKLKKQLNISK